MRNPSISVMVAVALTGLMTGCSGPQTFEEGLSEATYSIDGLVDIPVTIDGIGWGHPNAEPEPYDFVPSDGPSDLFDPPECYEFYLRLRLFDFEDEEPPPGGRYYEVGAVSGRSDSQYLLGFVTAREFPSSESASDYARDLIAISETCSDGFSSGTQYDTRFDFPAFTTKAEAFPSGGSIAIFTFKDVVVDSSSVAGEWPNKIFAIVFIGNAAIAVDAHFSDGNEYGEESLVEVLRQVVDILRQT